MVILAMWIEAVIYLGIFILLGLLLVFVVIPVWLIIGIVKTIQFFLWGGNGRI